MNSRGIVLGAWLLFHSWRALSEDNPFSAPFATQNYAMLKEPEVTVPHVQSRTVTPPVQKDSVELSVDPDLFDGFTLTATSPRMDCNDDFRLRLPLEKNVQTGDRFNWDRFSRGMVIEFPGQKHSSIELSGPSDTERVDIRYEKPFCMFLLIRWKLR